MSKVELAIKFGSNEIIVFQKGIGIVARQTTYLALSNTQRSSKIYAYGKQAQTLFEKRNSQYRLFQPIKGIEVIDKDKTILLLKQVLTKIITDKTCTITALVCVPCAMTEKKLLELKTILHKAGINKLTFVQNAVCVRANDLSVVDKARYMVVDIGKYLTDISVLSRYNFEFGRDYFIGGAEMDEAVQTYIQDNYNVVIPKELAERVKEEVASLYEQDMYTTTFEGINPSNMYQNITIRANEVRVAVVGVYNKIFDLISEVLDSLPAETVANIKENGIVFTGGVSSIDGLSEYASKKLDLPVITLDNPKDAVILGAGKLLNCNIKDYPHIDI